VDRIRASSPLRRGLRREAAAAQGGEFERFVAAYAYRQDQLDNMDH
jgi:hypothetical protein